LQSHTADHRALELELYYREGLEARHARAGAVTYA
jgi:hypothetical protein